MTASPRTYPEMVEDEARSIEGDYRDPAHIAAGDDLTESTMRLRASTGATVRALCGAENVPRPRGGRPVCTRCAEIAGAQRITAVDWLLHDSDTDRPDAS